MRGFSSLYRGGPYPSLLRPHAWRILDCERWTITMCTLSNRPVLSMCALDMAVRQYNTGLPSSTSHTGGDGVSDGMGMGTSTGISAPMADGNSSSSPPPLRGSNSTSCHSPRTVRLHNMPRTWMHGEIVEFLHQVAEHAGIEPPSPSQDKERNEDGTGRVQEVEEEEEDTTSAVPYVTSPFVIRMHIPFGRRTGIICGAPIIQLTSHDLAHYLLHDLTFDPDDYRSRIYFTEVPVTNTGSDGDSSAAATAASFSEQEAMESEQQEALETIELDRYLLAPDLLYDIARMRQRRLVTRSSKLLLETFADDEKEEKRGTITNDDEARAMDSTEKSQQQKKKKKMTLRPVGEYKEMGRGSMHSIPLAVPYVQGRRGTS